MVRVVERHHHTISRVGSCIKLMAEIQLIALRGIEILDHIIAGRDWDLRSIRALRGVSGVELEQIIHSFFLFSMCFPERIIKN